MQTTHAVNHSLFMNTIWDHSEENEAESLLFKLTVSRELRGTTDNSFFKSI